MGWVVYFFCTAAPPAAGVIAAPSSATAESGAFLRNTKRLIFAPVARSIAGDKTRALRLFGHCTERTAEPASQAQWQRVFESVGVPLEVVQTGCCGMCGVFGHEAEHLEESRGVFDMSWKKALPADDAKRPFTLVTGHSCRSQVKRFGGFVAQHPVEALRDLLSGR